MMKAEDRRLCTNYGTQLSWVCNEFVLCVESNEYIVHDAYVGYIGLSGHIEAHVGVDDQKQKQASRQPRIQGPT